MHSPRNWEGEKSTSFTVPFDTWGKGPEWSADCSGRHGRDRGTSSPTVFSACPS